MNKKVLSLILAACLSMSVLAGCGAKEEPAPAEPETKEEQSAEEEKKEEAEEKPAETASGVTIEYPANMQERGFTEALVLETMPEKVAVMSKAPVLALYELGVKMIAVPTSGVVAWPEELDASTEKLETGMNSNFDIETVIALEPDLVVMGYNSKDTYGKQLDDAEIPVYYVDAGHTVPYESVKAQTQVLVDAFGKEGEAGKAIMERFADLEARLDGMKDKYADKKVMVLQSAPPAHYIQTAEGTLASMAAMMGFGNVYENAEASMAPLDMETALSYNPDLVLCVGGTPDAAAHQKAMEADFAANPDYWNSIEAIKNGDVLYFSGSYIASTGIGFLDTMDEFIETVEAHYGAEA